MRGTEKRRNLGIIFTMLIAFSVRLIGISSRPIWYDEAFAVLFSEKGPGAMLYGTLTATSAGAADIHPLGYYTLLWLWMSGFGQSLVAVRTLSILTGVTTVFLIYLLAQKLFNPYIGSIAALFVALAPFPIHYSQEIRMYSFLTLLLMTATYAYLRGSNNKSWGWWALFSISSALAQYTHNLAAFYLIPLAITPLFHRDKKSLFAVVLAGLGAVVLYLPWLVQVPSQFTKISNAYWVERPGFAKLFTLLLNFITNLPLPENWLFPALFIALAVTAIGLMQTFRASNRNQSALWMLYLSFAPPILLFTVSQWVPVYIERALLPSGVIFCIWLAWSIFGTPMPKTLRYALSGLLVIGASMGIFQHLTYRAFPYAPYQELDAYLRTKMVAGDAIVHSNKLSMIPANYFDRSLPQLYIADPPGGRTDTLAEATQEVLGLIASPDISAATSNADRVWFIIFEQSIRELQAAGANTHPHLEYLRQHFRQVDVKDWDGLKVYLFEKKQ
jgi:4-amino-4-deoxy-L-arabinose transferase-like glycosyltransferase